MKINVDKNNFLSSILSADGVIGSKSRWWAGSKEFDFAVSAEGGFKVKLSYAYLIQLFVLLFIIRPKMRGQ